MPCLRLRMAPVVIACQLVAATALAQQRPTAFDLASMSRGGDVQISPDGETIVYLLTKHAFDKSASPSPDDTDAGWTTTRQLYMAPATGGEARQLTFSDDKPSSPRFSWQGDALAFVRAVDGKSRINVLRLEGGEARPVDTSDLEPGSFAWSPDGRFFAFTATTPKTKQEKHDKWASGGAVVYHGEWRSSHLWIVPVQGGEPRRVIDDDENIVDFTWAPDGKRLAIVSSPTADPYDVFNQNTARIISSRDGSTIRELTTEPREVANLRWSPDGRSIAFETTHDSLSLLNVLRVVDVRSGRSTNAAAALDPTLMGFTWSGDSESIIANVTERTKTKLYRLPLDGTGAEPMKLRGRVIQGAMQSSFDGERLAFLSSTPIDPADPTTLDVASGRVHLTMSLNPQVRDWRLANLEVVQWKDPEGVEIEGLLYRTPGAARGARTPLMVLPHGGPDSVSTERFDAWAQYFAARGFSVLRPNYRGGLGYGHDFYAANRGRLGEIEWMDIESGVDALIASGKVDPERLVFGGWSWGGYLTTWAIGHSQRYKAAVAGAAVVDVVSQYALSDINHGVAAQWEFKGNPWLQWDNFDRANPMRSLQNATTPTLIIQGMKDQRVAFSASRILFRALKDVGCETKFLAYPREPHGFREPAHIVHMLTAWANWYDAHVTQ